MNYAYNEALMMKSIQEYKKLTPSTRQQIYSISLPVLPQEVRPTKKEVYATNPKPKITRWKQPTSNAVIAAASEVFNVSPDSIVCRSRQHFLVRPRQAISIVLSQNGYSLTRIGGILNRHHTTIMYEVKTGRALLETNPLFRAAVDEIMSMTTRIPPAASPEAILGESVAS